MFFIEAQKGIVWFYNEETEEFEYQFEDCEI